MEKILNKCPICGGTLYTDNLYQYSFIYKIGKRGRELKKSRKKEDNGTLECFSIYCENLDFRTDYTLNVIKPYNSNISILQNTKGKFMYEKEGE